MTSPRRSLAGGSLLFVLAFLVFCSQPSLAIPAFARIGNPRAWRDVLFDRTT